MTGDDVFLTGATGFVGSHVLDALVKAGYRVRALVRGMPDRWPGDQGVTPVVGDLRRPGELLPAMRGCRYLVHVAAHYSFAPRDRELIRQSNVRGTSGLLEVARMAQVEKAVVTSSSAVVGPAQDSDHPATEDHRLPPGHGIGYHASKLEQEVVSMAAQVPVVEVLPTAPVGPGDRRPTPTGKMVLDFIRGRMVATIEGGMNLVPVEDVAQGHVLAMQKGWPGERYLLGGENLSFDQIWAILDDISGQQAPRVCMDHDLVLALAAIDELRCRIMGGTPWIPLEGALMARQLMYTSSDKAARELGWWSGPVKDALDRSVSWFRDQGRVSSGSGH
jgi:dihydroflavonol-4-reductase